MSVCSLGLKLFIRSPCVRKLQSTRIWWRTMSNRLLDRPVEKVGKVDGPGSQFSVLSYNILSDNLSQQHPELYSDCDEKYLTWEHRGPQLIREVVSYDADVLCFQEVEKGHFDSTLVPGLGEHGFKGIHVARNGNHHDGCASFYRTEKFNLIEHRPVEYHKQGSRILDRDNVALLLLLQSRRAETKEAEKEDCDGNTDEIVATNSQCNSPNTVVVANTHILFNPRRGDVKLAQIMLLMAEIQQLSAVKDADPSSPCRYHPAVMAGDYNLVPFSPLYWFLITGGLYYEGADQFGLSGQERRHNTKPLSGATANSLLSAVVGVSNRCAYEDLSLGQRFQNTPAITHQLGLASAYQHFFTRDEPEYTTYHNHVCCTVDYIMYSSDEFRPGQGLSVLPYRQKLALLGRRRLIRQAQMHPLGPMPNRCYSSDHLSIQAFFQFREATGAASGRRPDASSAAGSNKKVCR